MAGWIIAVIVVIISGIVIWNIKKDSTSQNQPVVPVANSRQQSSQPTMLSTRIETGPMVYYANDTHGATDKEYRFNYKKVNGAWRAYILRMPSLGNLLWSSIFVTLMANKIGGLQFGIYRNCQISSRVFHTAVAALPLTKANRSDFE